MISPAQRGVIYSEMLEVILNDPDYKATGIYYTGLCDLLLEVSGRNDYEFMNFPEIAKHKPKELIGVYQYWWDHKIKEGTSKRIEVLKQAIKDAALI